METKAPRKQVVLDQESLEAIERLKKYLHTDNTSYVIRLALIHELERLDKQARDGRTS